jgi:hypothetical protein
MNNVDNILNKQSSDVGPFAHSERTPKPNTLPKTEGFSSSGEHGKATSGNTYAIRGNVHSESTGISYEMPELTTEFLNKVYHASHIYILFAFLAIYLVIYIGLAFFLKKNGNENIDLILKKVFDYTIILIIIVWMIWMYNNSPVYTKENLIQVIWNWSVDWMKDPINWYGIIFFTIAFYIWVFFMHINMSHEHTPFLIKLLEDKLWIILVSYIIFVAFQYVLGVDIYGFLLGNALVDGIIKKTTDYTVDEKGILRKEVTGGSGNVISGSAVVNHETAHTANAVVQGNTIDHDEVFNIGNNLYTYDDAQHVCSAYGARLANYDEIEDAYNHGGEWCNYGWSDGQMIYFPTQKSTWDKLQKDPANKNKCGRPGVNGGFMQNKHLRFGVNCYGKKPKPTQAELDAMNQAPPKTAEQAQIDKKVEFWKKNADALLKVNSFNKEKWSEF